MSSSRADTIPFFLTVVKTERVMCGQVVSLMIDYTYEFPMMSAVNLSPSRRSWQGPS